MRKDLVSFIVVLVIGFVIFGNFLTGVFSDPKPSESYAEKVDYSEFRKIVEAHKIERVTFVDDKIVGLLSRSGGNSIDTSKSERVYTINPETDNSELIGLLLKEDVKIEKIEAEVRSVMMDIFISWFPMILLIAVWIFFMHQMQSPGGGRGAMSFGKSKARLLGEDQVKTTFADVAGVDEAKEEVQELVEFLKDPARFRDLGGKIPTGVLMLGSPGVGKAQPLHSKIRIPGGWKTMGELRIGDMVCNPEGGYAKVVELFPQGKKANYKIYFDDETISESCDEHLWKVSCHGRYIGYKILALKEIIEDHEKGYPIRLPTPERIDGDEISLPINPYVLGVLLGDGCLATANSTISISSADNFVIEKVSSLLHDEYELVYKAGYDWLLRQKKEHKTPPGQGRLGVFQNRYAQSLWDMGLLKKKSYEKYIPEVYFYSSYEQRLNLLQGIADADGHASVLNSASITTTSKDFADGIIELARSLGFIAWISRERTTSYTYREELKTGRLSYEIRIQAYNMQDIFSLPRKAERLSTRQNRPVKRIEKIEYVGEEEMQCILLDSENHLYITDGYNITHNTLLARAIAGEAKVPFFTISGSDFVEMFVGVGASRVRDMFEQAKKRAPCIVFIDEIDAVGRHRGAGMGGGHDEREQTLNQLLVEMDGFEENGGVIIIAATNRPDVLDPALLRPGRFDRHVQVPMPDIKGREQILDIHMKKLPSVHANAKSQIIARGTPGFSGADLANLVNEAALFTARVGKKIVSMHEFMKARDKIMFGHERKTMMMDDDEKRTTAYHEAGHCIIGRTVPSCDPVYKVSIIPRGRALGITMFLPEKDEYGTSKEKLLSMLATAYGGRVAEEIILGPEKVTTGASNDILKATDIARKMVMEWGLSDKLGPIAYGGNEKEVFVGRMVTEQANNISPDKANLIDCEITKFLDDAFQVAKKILNEKINILHSMAEALLEYETIEIEQIDDLMLGNKAKPIEAYRDTNNTDEGEITDENKISNLGLGFAFGRNKPGNTSE